MLGDHVWTVDGVPVPQGSLRSFMAGGHPVLTYTNREPLALWRDAVRDTCPLTEPDIGPWSIHIQFRMQRPLGHYGKRSDGGNTPNQPRHLPADVEVLPRFLNARPAKRPDLDKLVRAVLDALTMRVWRDDGQVVEIKASKRYSDTPGATIMVDKL